MKVPYSWLREYCAPDLSPEELAELLALRTTEVERVSRVGPPEAEGFVVGRVASVAPHPNADRLSVCEVETGDGRRTIVCGAPNVAEGQTVPVALPGAIMPGGQELAPADLRGVTSEGMILSEAELEIGDDADGIAVLDGAVGSRQPAFRPAADRRAGARARGRLEPGRLPGRLRGGAARSTPSARRRWPIPRGSATPMPAGSGEVSDYASVSVEVPELCPRFTRPRVHGGDDRPVSAVAEGTTRRPPVSGRSTTSSTSPTT